MDNKKLKLKDYIHNEKMGLLDALVKLNTKARTLDNEMELEQVNTAIAIAEEALRVVENVEYICNERGKF